MTFVTIPFLSRHARNDAFRRGKGGCCACTALATITACAHVKHHAPTHVVFLSQTLVTFCPDSETFRGYRRRMNNLSPHEQNAGRGNAYRPNNSRHPHTHKLNRGSPSRAPSPRQDFSGTPNSVHVDGSLRHIHCKIFPQVPSTPLSLDITVGPSFFIYPRSNSSQKECDSRNI